MGAPHVQIRGYVPTDLKAIFQLDQVCFDKPFRFSFAEMRRLAEAKNGNTIIADSHGKLAGFCIVSFEKHSRANRAYLSTIDVDATCRGIGVGSLLLSAAETEALQAGCTAMSLHVFVENASAIRLYERAGYVLLQTQPDFYGPGLDALVYGRQLASLHPAL